MLSLIGTEEARKGNLPGARNALAQFEQMRKTQYVDAFMPMLVSKALNDHEHLVMWLRRAEEEHSSFFVYLHPYAPYWGLNEIDLAGFDKARSRS